MRRLWFLSFIAIIGVLLFGSASWAQSPAVAPRISGPVDESSRTTLKGNVPSKARAQFDQGKVAGSTQLTHVRLVLSPSSEQQAALDKYMAELQDKSSPNYRKWLTPQQFGKLYGPADSDVAAVVAWLESHGLKLEEVSPGRTNIAFSGTVNQLEEAFHTSIHSFNADGETFVSNVTDPSIPAALASVVVGVAHLDTIKPRPHHVGGGLGKLDPDLGRLVPVGPESSSSPTPQLTTGSAGAYFLYMVAGDAATIYDTPNTFNANYSSGTSYTGQGVTIGIGGDAPILPATVANYRNRFLGNSTQPINTNVDGVTDTTDTGEAYIDTELSGAMAPGATIHFYTSTDLVSAIEQAINDNTVDVFSLSFGACELGLTTAQNALINSWWKQAATQGIAVTVSTGDNGSAGCDNNSTETSAIQGLQVSGFASTPYNIAVGGTDFNALPNAFTTYAGTSNAGSFYRTAKSYIPESTWNDSVVTDGTISASAPYTDNKGNTNIVAGSGGVSACSTNTTAINVGTCTSGYAKPSWQRGTGVPADGARDLPDVSLMAGNGFDSAAWLVCTDTTGTVSGVAITANCTTQSNNQFYFQGFGGTSTSAPAFAGILALVQQKAGSRLGQAAKNLYDLYNGSHAAAVFHDVTVGNISVVCTTATPNCALNTAGYPFLTGYDTTAGYDLATGLGSVDATQLVNFWISSTGSTASTVTVTPSPTTLTTKQSLSVAVTVTGTGGTPTGTVTLDGGGYTSTQTLSNTGSYTFTVPAGSFTSLGTFDLTVTYSGDSTYATTSTTSSITVNAPTATLTVTPSKTVLTTTDSLSVVVTAQGTSGTPTGTVSLVGGGYTSPVQTLSNTGTYTFTVPAGSFTVLGTFDLSVTYSGDTTYATKTTINSITVNASTATVSVTPSLTSLKSNVPLTVTGTVSGAGPTPTGSVTLSGGGYTAPAQVLAAGAYSFTIPANKLSAGTDSLTVSYGGDLIYAAANASATVTVTNSLTPTVTVTPVPTTINVNQSLTVTASVSGSGATPTGTVTLSGGGYTSSVQTLNSTGAFIFTIPANSLAKGADLLTITYSGNTVYSSGTGTTTVTVNLLTPTVAVTPSATTIYTTTPLTVTAKVTGTGATPTGTVTLSGGGYTSTAQTLSGGSYAFTIPANSLSVGVDTLTVTYSGDTTYTTASSSATVTVANPLTPTVTVTPASATLNSGQTLSVVALVAGTGPTPTGSVTLSGGGYTSSAQALAAGTYTFTIPANSLSAGTDTLTVAYSGDSTYTVATGTSSVTVTASVYALTATTPAAVTAGGASSSTITVSSTTGYAGTVTLTCALTASPTGAVHLPTCAAASGGSSVALSSTTTTGTGTINISTTAAVAQLERPGFGGWAGAGGGAVLAFMVFLRIPARRRSWQSMLGVLVVLVALGSLAGCGGGGGSIGGGGGGGTPGTTAGSYTFTVTGTGSPAVTPAPTQTFTLTVN